MIILKSCLLIATLLPFLSKFPLAFAMNKAGGYDNAAPRAQQSRLKGFGARALAAHQNSFEALIIFGIAALFAIATQHVTFYTDVFAITFIIARLIYHVAYLMDLPSFRSIVWCIGFFASIAIFCLSMP